MKKGSLLYEGKAKKIYATDQEDILFVEYKDSATAFNGEKKAEFAGKGSLNNQISSFIFTKMKEELDLPTHFIQQVSDHEQLIKRVEIFPLEVVVRNVSAGSMAKRLGIEEGIPLEKPIIEFYLKDDELGDPLITEDHIRFLKITSSEEMEQIKKMALDVNQFLISLFDSLNIRLIDFKLEFGKDPQGQILLADEISPDTCRLWEKETNRKLDKDVFRRNLGNLIDAYTEVLTRLEGESTCIK